MIIDDVIIWVVVFVFGLMILKFYTWARSRTPDQWSVE